MKYYKGMDISTLLEVERCGGKFYDKREERELLSILKDYDVNALRVRLWNHPYSEEGKPYGAGNTDYETTLRMAKRVKAAGLGFLLDFHYSDFWADPGKQRKPKAWADYNADQLEEAVYDFTKEILNRLNKENIIPDMIRAFLRITAGVLDCPWSGH